jgi:hypothetical protein
MGIKIIREKKATDYTFIDDRLNVKKPAEKKEPDGGKDKTECDFRLREDVKASRLRKSNITGGHSMQGHSPVYE